MRSALLVALLLLLPATAAARPPDPDEREGARLEAEGKRLFDRGDLGGAARLFRQAFDADGRPKHLYNAARTYEVMGDTPRAIAWYEKFLPVAHSAKDAESTKKKIEEMREKLPATHGQATFVSEPSGAQLDIEGYEVEAPLTAPVTLWLAPGRYSASFAINGFNAARRDFSVARGATVMVSVKLERIRLPAHISVDSVDGAVVYLGRRSLGPVPIRNMEIEPGTYEISVRREGYDSAEKAVTVAEGQHVRLSVDLKPRSVIKETLLERQAPERSRTGARLRTWGWVSVGTAAAAAAAGGTLNYLAVRRAEEADAMDKSTPDRHSEFVSEYRGARDMMLASQIAFGVSGAAALAGGVLLAAGYLTGDETEAALSPVPGGGAFVFTTTF